MELLKIIKHSDLFPKHSSDNSENSEFRQASRAIVFDNDGKVALLFVAKHNYHKLPGGGVEEGEELMEALRREVLEEIGCKISVNGEIGKIIEHRDEFNLKQESFCYLAKLEGEKGNPNFTKEETANGFKILWVPLDEAIELVKKDMPDNYEGKFIKARDLCFLEEAKLQDNL